MNFPNYRHGHLHTLWSTIRGAGGKHRDWPGDDISEAEARAADGTKWEARSPDAVVTRGGNRPTGRHAPGLVTLLWGRGRTKHPPPFLQPSFPRFPPAAVPEVAIRPSRSWRVPQHGGLQEQKQGKGSLPSSPVARTSHPERRNAAGARGSLRLLKAQPHTQAGEHRLASVLKINSPSGIYFYISGRLGSGSASQSEAHLFNGILKM